MRICLLGVACWFMLTAAAQAAEGVPTRIGPDKKIIEWGWDEPGPAFMRQHAARMDRYGFDGVIFHAEPTVNGKPVNFAWSCWSKQRFEYDQFAQNVADLKACAFQRMTDNFLRFNVCPGEVDWFDDEGMAAVMHNARVAAKVAREGGCKGFMFDVEMYGKPLFTYPEQVHKDTKSFAEYEAKVRQRGREFMRAVNSEYPDITMLLTYAYSITGTGPGYTKSTYGLLRGFLDGMLEAVAPRTVLVDAWEGAYSYRHYKQFASAYDMVRHKLIQLCAVPHKYRQHLQVGFGVWMDYDFRRYGWHLTDLERNYFTPDEFAYSLFAGLNKTDRYVWVYTEKPLWWTNTRVPVGYRRALHRAKGPLVLDDKQFPARNIKGYTGSTGPKAAEQPNYTDEALFGDLKEKWTFVADAPRTWKFRTDPRKEGLQASWFAPGLELKDWRDMQIGKFWDEQGVVHVGQAWYRVEWDVPAFTVPVGGQSVLWFGAADETAQVWVNGQLAGGHDEGADYGWDKRFPIDVTGKLLPGQKNTVAVLVGNEALAGGLWKNIKLAVSK